MAAITEEDLQMVKYFWQDKGDVKRWCDWEKRLPDFERERPEIPAAVRALVVAERTLDAICESL